jgi:hypothetical protein
MDLKQQVEQGITTTEAVDKIKALKKKAPAADAAGKPETEGDQKAKTAKPADKAAKKPAAKEQPAKSQAKPTAAAEDGQAEEEQNDDGAQGEATDDADADGQPGDDAGQDQTAEGDEEAETGADEGDEQLHVLTIDGKTVEVEYGELIKLAQQGHDYSKKLNAVAQERREVERLKEEVADLPEQRKQAQEQAERFGKNAGLVLLALERGFLPPEPSAELLEKNPAAYVKQKEARQEGLNLMAALSAEVDGFQKQAEAQAKAELAKAVETGRKKLFEMHTDFAGESDKAKANRKDLIEYAKKHGFSDEHIKNEPNPILFSWAIKAMRYDRLMEKKATLKPDHERPKVTSNQSSPDDARTSRDRNRSKARDNHRASGTVGSAAAAISASRKNR